MQVSSRRRTDRDLELASERLEKEKVEPSNGEARRMISLPGPRTLLTAAAVTGGIFAVGLVAYYCIRARRNNSGSRYYA